MHYVYILQSDVNKHLYVGFSNDLRQRYASHNAGRVRSTQAFRPWKLVYYEAYASIHDAAKREKQLKNHAAKEVLKVQIKNSLE